MATISHTFFPTDALPFPITGAAPLDVQSGGTGDPHMPCLLFDADTDEFAQFLFRATSYGSGNLTVTVLYSMASATAGAVYWAAQIRALTPGDSQDVLTDTFATATGTSNTVPGTAGYAKDATITVSNLDSIAANDYVTLQVYRDANGTLGTDDATGDAELLAVTVTYSDT
jgi:hypothetical protein